MLQTDRYHTCTSSKCGCIDSHNAGTMNTNTRMMLDPIVGQVLPSPSNIDEQLKMMPFAAKFHDVIMSMVAPMATTSSSYVKMCMSRCEPNWQKIVSNSMIPMLRPTVQLKVSR